MAGPSTFMIPVLTEDGERYQMAKAELKNWLENPDATNFHSLLYRLIAKSDPSNRWRLRLGFPEEVKVWEDWHAAESESQFFAV